MFQKKGVGNKSPRPKISAVSPLSASAFHPSPKPSTDGRATTSNVTVSSDSAKRHPPNTNRPAPDLVPHTPLQSAHEIHPQVGSLQSASPTSHAVVEDTHEPWGGIDDAHAMLSAQTQRSDALPSAPAPEKYVRKAARMKPESKAFQKRMGEQLRARVRSRERKEERKRSNVAYTSLADKGIESDDAGAGPLDPDDSVYQGRVSRARTSKGRDRINTRNDNRFPSKPSLVPLAHGANSKGNLPSPSPEFNDHHPTDCVPDAASPATSVQSVLPESSTFIDDEAEETDNAEGPNGDSVEENAEDDTVGLDDYDYEDSFIDDESDANGDTRKKLSTKRQASGSPPAPPVPKKIKGKQRATRTVRSPTPHSGDDDQDDNDGLSDYSRRELQDLQAAMKASTEHSRKDRHTTHVGSSKDARPNVPTPDIDSNLTMAELAARYTANSSQPSSSEQPSRKIGRPAPPAGFLRKCLNLPRTCEVTDVALWDPLLAHVYPTLPPLRKGTQVPWTSAPGQGQVSFMGWSQQAPQMPARLALQALNYVGTKWHIKNVSRISPECVLLRIVRGPSDRHNLYLDTNPPRPLVAYSAGFLEHSQLLTNAGSSLAHRYIRIYFHTQEWERFQGFVATATGYPVLHAQVGKDAMQFSTRPQGSSGGSSNPSPKATSGGMFKSPSRNQTASVSNDINFSLPNDVPIPVYDARNAPSTFDLERDMPQIASLLPLYEEGEIPYGSLVGVGYTMSIFRSNVGNMTLGCNIQWVILFGTPPETQEDDENGGDGDENA